MFVDRASILSTALQSHPPPASPRSVMKSIKVCRIDACLLNSSANRVRRGHLFARRQVAGYRQKQNRWNFGIA
jgi:hypothetical protein